MNCESNSQGPISTQFPIQLLLGWFRGSSRLLKLPLFDSTVILYSCLFKTHQSDKPKSLRREETLWDRAVVLEKFAEIWLFHVQGKISYEKTTPSRELLLCGLNYLNIRIFVSSSVIISSAPSSKWESKFSALHLFFGFNRIKYFLKNFQFGWKECRVWAQYQPHS